MFIVNAGPGFRKVLWPAAQRFIDAKTIAKIQARLCTGFVYLSIPHVLQLQLTCSL